MTRLVAICVLVLAMALPAQAQEMALPAQAQEMALPAQAQDRGAIEDTIGGQLEAFNDRDIDEAWQYASPTIQGMFGSPQNFGAMVQQGYPMVWSNSEVRYLELREIGGRLWQKVMLRDAQGGLHVLDYQMIETEGGWQINGVQLLPAPDVGA